MRLTVEAFGRVLTLTVERAEQDEPAGEHDVCGGQFDPAPYSDGAEAWCGFGFGNEETT